MALLAFGAGYLILCGGGCPVPCRVFSSLPGLYTLCAGGQVPFPSHVDQSKIFPRALNHP